MYFVHKCIFLDFSKWISKGQYRSTFINPVSLGHLNAILATVCWKLKYSISNAFYRQKREKKREKAFHALFLKYFFWLHHLVVVCSSLSDKWVNPTSSTTSFIWRLNHFISSLLCFKLLSFIVFLIHICFSNLLSDKKKVFFWFHYIMHCGRTNVLAFTQAFHWYTTVYLFIFSKVQPYL